MDPNVDNTRVVLLQLLVKFGEEGVGVYWCVRGKLKEFYVVMEGLRVVWLWNNGS